MSYFFPKVHPGTPIKAVINDFRYGYVVIPSPESGLGQQRAYPVTDLCRELDVGSLEHKWIYTPVKFYDDWYGTGGFYLWRGWSAELPVEVMPATLAETLEHFPFFREIPGTEKHDRLYSEWCDSTQRQDGDPASVCSPSTPWGVR